MSAGLRREAEGLWREMLAHRETAAARGKLLAFDPDEGNRQAFIRLYEVTRWEDLAFTLAPHLAEATTDPAHWGRRKVEAFIDANFAHLEAGRIAPTTLRALRAHGWRKVAHALRAFKAGQPERVKALMGGKVRAPDDPEGGDK